MRITEAFPGPVNTLIFYNAHAKAAAVRKIAESAERPAIILDFDMLYGGYARAGLIKPRWNVELCTPTIQDWPSILSHTVSRMTESPTTAILDSLNGFYSLYDMEGSGRMGNSAVMLLASVAAKTDSQLFVSNVAGLTKNGWVLRPSGRHVVENASFSKFLITSMDPFRMHLLDRSDKTERIIDWI